MGLSYLFRMSPALGSAVFKILAGGQLITDNSKSACVYDNHSQVVSNIGADRVSQTRWRKLLLIQESIEPDHGLEGRKIIVATLFHPSPWFLSHGDKQLLAWESDTLKWSEGPRVVA